MLGRFSKVMAIAAICTQMWVSMIVAPWHHLVEHRLPAAVTETKTAESSAVPVQKTCRCHRHQHCQPAKKELAGQPGPAESAPLAPHDADDCPVCQVLTQAVVTVDLPTPTVTTESVEFPPLVSAVRPSLGLLLEPVSRGPPSAC